MPAFSQSFLDNLRFSNGREGLKNYYRGLLGSNREKALETINDQKLRFCTLYLLRHELAKASALNELRPLYRRALEVAEELGGERTRQTEKAMRSGNEDTVSVLRWMVRTGYIEDDPGGHYEELMDRSAALLTKSFKDTTALPEIAEMIFARHRSGRLVHDLAWAFFEARNLESLGLIVRRLNSPYTGDADLAKKLLCFVPVIDDHPRVPGPALYVRVLQWLHENRPFLHYTGESLHLCSSPMHYAVSRAAKYLCRPVSVDTGEPLAPLNVYEMELASRFKELPEHLQQQLSEFSHTLYRRNIYQWNAWIRLSQDEQARLAAYMMGGLT